MQGRRWGDEVDTDAVLAAAEEQLASAGRPLPANRVPTNDAANLRTIALALVFCGAFRWHYLPRAHYRSGKFQGFYHTLIAAHWNLC